VLLAPYNIVDDEGRQSQVLESHISYKTSVMSIRCLTASVVVEDF